jgi:uncharacterized SAM-binding protein YcdF (DUF218 family)
MDSKPPCSTVSSPFSLPPLARGGWGGSHHAFRKLIRRLLLGLAFALLGLGFATWLMPTRILTPVAQFLDVSEPPRPVDFVLILNGDPETRPFAAAAMVKAGFAKTVLLTHQQLTLESGNVQSGGTLSEFELTRQVLLARGVPAADIQILPGEIGSSFDELKKLAEFLNERPEATVAVVTNYFHTRRSRWVLRRLLGEQADRVSFVGVPRERVDDATWWRSKMGCAIYLTEYPKFAYYWARY